MQIPTLDYRPSPRLHPDLGIGIIGAGGIVRNAHLPAYRAAGFPVVAIADVRAGAAEEVGRQFGIPQRVSDYRHLLENPAVKVVDIAIPGEGRVEVVRDVAAAGKHILIQKPMANTLTEAVTIVRLAREAGVLLAVNQNARWAPPYRATWSLLRQGFLGTVYHVTHLMRNNQDSQPTLQQSWYAREPRFQMVQYTVHYIDLLRFWVGREPRRVWAQTSRKPGQAFRGEVIATLVLDFGPELQAIILDHNASWPECPVTVEFVVEGTDGQIVGDVQQNRLQVRHRTWPRMAWEPALEGRWFPTAFAGTMGDLLDAIADARPPAVSGDDHLRTLAIIEAAYLSAAEGRAVAPSDLLRADVGDGGAGRGRAREDGAR